MICSRSIHPPSEETLHTQPATTKSMFYLILGLKRWFMHRRERRAEHRCQVAFKRRQKNQKLQSDTSAGREHSISTSIRVSETCAAWNLRRHTTAWGGSDTIIQWPFLCNFKATSICQTTINWHGSVTSACVKETCFVLLEKCIRCTCAQKQKNPPSFSLKVYQQLPPAVCNTAKQAYITYGHIHGW